eukprot:3417271-Karenia_brevis.AAC.1
MSGAGTPDPPSSPVVSVIGVVGGDVQREEEVGPFERVDISVHVGIQYESDVYMSIYQRRPRARHRRPPHFWRV